MKNILKTMMVLCSVGFVSCGDHLDVAGVKYRKKAGPMISIGDVGFKNKDGAGEIIPFDKYQPSIRGMKPDIRTIMQTEETSKLSGELGVTGYGKADAGRTKSEKGRFKIYSLRGQWIRSFYEEMGKIQNKKALANLKRWGSDARIVLSVAKAYSYEKSRSASFSVVGDPVTIGTVEGQAKISGEGSSNVKFSDGTNLAYEICRIAWSKKSTGEWVIEELVPDRPGFDKKELERKLENKGWTLNPHN